MIGTRTGTVAARLAAPVAVLAALLAVAPPVATAETGSAGLEFYSPAADLVPGEHGSVIRSRPLTGDPALPGARNYLVLYRSVDTQGAPVAVSGTLAVPEGEPPAGGWPLISWAHGTTGTADICAPSRDTDPSFPAHDYTALARDIQARWIAAGYAVAQTDYQGLGTPGAHGYLIGEAEQRAVADIATAARVVAPEVGTRWVAMGHSQGGQAAIFANARSQQWAPGMRLLGSVAMAPASHLGPVVRGLGVIGHAGIAADRVPAGSVAFLPLFLRGAETVAPIDPSTFLAPQALSMLGQADNRCVAQLRAADSWGGLDPGTVFTDDPHLDALTGVLDANDPSSLPLTTPLLVQQGSGDTVVLPLATDAMVARQRIAGQAVDYRTYSGIDHRGLLDAGYDDALAWVNTRFGR
ncbi:lipase family protein [Nocardia sp. NPDC051833]|uniref:alpha/beta hydrolase family protein n=1 Tax=Nocardia sp. NPDC051833 TaxID=3155674 RepID=UPI003417601D